MEQIMKDITAGRFNPKPTGIDKLDDMLDGGLHKQLYVLCGDLGAASSFSKKIAENISYQDQKVLYFLPKIIQSDDILNNNENLIVFERLINYSINNILDIIENYIKVTTNIPVVFIDGLDVLDEKGPQLARALLQIKVGHKSPVFVNCGQQNDDSLYNAVDVVLEIGADNSLQMHKNRHGTIMDPIQLD